LIWCDPFFRLRSKPGRICQSHALTQGLTFNLLLHLPPCTSPSAAKMAIHIRAQVEKTSHLRTSNPFTAHPPVPYMFQLEKLQPNQL
jgi:hypothetical protein